MPKSITIKLDDDTTRRAIETADKFGISINRIIKDAVENFLPYSTIPDKFITDTGLSNVLKKGVPIRSILPFTSSMLRYNMVGDFEINIKGVKAL